LSNIKDYDFNIPERLIAQKPTDKRSDSRLLVYLRKEDRIIDSFTKNLPDFLDEDYFLVFNNSNALPGRLKIIKESNGREGEALVLKVIDSTKIEVITDKVKKYKKGTIIILPDGERGVVEDSETESVKIIKTDKDIFNYEYFETYGKIPIPPYIKNGQSDEHDNVRYRTVFGKEYGSAAAPTAGLHFDEKIFEGLISKKIDYAFVTLNVGLGTFQPVYAENIEDHQIHTEEYFILPEEASKINKAIEKGKKIVAVGTTSLRTLESSYSDGKIRCGQGKTNLYIRPPCKLKIVDVLFTNFHTPKSSLLILVSAILGREKVFEIYDYAIEKEYRFFSYGDAMLIL